ncbi:MAG TPA: dihydropteroate synthase [Candidatus Binataceae bacterium]|nr:dihydropteroate synthase [Candidatus Binataceae bacterium]
MLHDGRSIALPAVMGVLNVTPDSFSDGGCFMEPERALEQALRLEAEGAAIIDVGGESTRPAGARALTVEAELARVVPVLELLRRRLRIPFSIDTRKAEIARVALERDAVMINDVSALAADAAMAPLAAQSGCAVVLMHMRGSVENHAKYARYGNVTDEVVRFLCERVRFALAAGIRARRIIIDPGLGFAKNAHHNLELLGSLARLCRLGYPLLIGASRKRFVRAIAGESAADMRAGNAAVHALALAGGASILRVHEAADAAAVIRMVEAVRRAGA